MTRDEILAGWLAISRYALGGSNNLDEFFIPKAIGDALIERGWQAREGGDKWVITAAGKAASDLAAPEWGIDPLDD